MTLFPANGIMGRKQPNGTHMPRQKAGRSAYLDVIPYMDIAAAKQRRIEIDAPTPGKAIRIVQRMNQWRLIDRQQHEDLESKYDMLIFKRVDCTAIIEPRTRASELVVRDEDGSIIPPEWVVAFPTEKEMLKDLEDANKPKPKTKEQIEADPAYQAFDKAQKERWERQEAERIAREKGVVLDKTKLPHRGLINPLDPTRSFLEEE